MFLSEEFKKIVARIKDRLENGPKPSPATMMNEGAHTPRAGFEKYHPRTAGQPE